MNKLILQFFGGGSTSTEQVRVRDPEPEELTDFRSRIDQMLSPLMGGERTDAWNNSNFGQSYLNAKDRVAQAYQGFDNAQSYYDQAMQGIGEARQYYDDSQSRYGSVMDDLHGITMSGEIPQAMTDNMNYTVDRALDKSMGASLNDLAGRGVLNSSVTNRSVNALSDSAADAYSKNYLGAYNAVTGSLNNMGNSLNSNLSNANGLMGQYNNAASNANTQMGIYQDAPAKIWEGQQAEYAPAYNFWKDWQNSYDSSEDYDTVVTQGK